LAADGRVSKNQVKALPRRWRWKEYSALLQRAARSRVMLTYHQSNSPIAKAFF